MNLTWKPFILAACFASVSISQGYAAPPLAPETSASPGSTPLSLSEIAPALYKTTAADRNHGEVQVTQMMKDRPALKTLIYRGDPIWNWLVQQFAGEGIGCRIYWEKQPPENGAVAENRYKGARAQVAIRFKTDESGRKVDPESQCICPIYELMNIRNGSAFDELCARSDAGKISKKEWVAKNTLLEYKALLATRLFYYSLWLPTMRSRKIETNRYSWRVDLPLNYSEWIDSKDAKFFVQYWGACYESDHPRPRKKKLH